MGEISRQAVARQPVKKKKMFSMSVFQWPPDLIPCHGDGHDCHHDPILSDLKMSSICMMTIDIIIVIIFAIPWHTHTQCNLEINASPIIQNWKPFLGSQLTDNGKEIYTYNWSEGNGKKEGGDIFSKLIDELRFPTKTSVCLVKQGKKNVSLPNYSLQLSCPLDGRAPVNNGRLIVR